MSEASEKRDEIRRGKAKDLAVSKALVGRRIVKVEPNGTWEEGEADGGYGAYMHAWILTLDDGTRVGFITEEHPIGAEYGTDIVLIGRKL